MVQGEDSDEIRVMDQTQKFLTSHWNMTDITQVLITDDSGW